jgi:autotransporter-associated beta strand protein
MERPSGRESGMRGSGRRRISERGKPAGIVVAGAAALAALPACARGMSFTFTYDSAVAARGDFGPLQSAMDYAARQFTDNYSDPIAINILVNQSSSISLGQSSFPVNSYSYATIRSALISHSTSPDDALAVASLPASDPIGGTHDWWMSQPQQRALGFATAPGSDGTFTFNTAGPYTFDPANRSVGGSYDFIGVAEHEISEILGRIYGVGRSINSAPAYLPMDLYRFTSPGVRSMNQVDSSVYFSLDSGTTNLKFFNDPGNGGDFQDWASGAADSYNAFLTQGIENPMTPVDVTAVDVIGYTRTSVPSTITWDGGTSGSGTLWWSGANWAGDIWPSSKQTAVFAAAGSATSIGIVMDSDGAGGNLDVGAIQLSNAIARNITLENPSAGADGTLKIFGVGGVLLSNDSASNTLTIQNGATNALNVVLAGSGNINVTNASATINITSNVSGTGGFTKTGAGLTQLSGTLSYTGSTTVSGGTLRLLTNLTSSPAVTINSGMLQLASNATNLRFIRTPALSVIGSGKLDLTDNKLIVPNGNAGTWNGSNYTGLTGLVRSGRNGNTLPLWDGSGIITSQTAATGGNFTSIAIARGSDAKPATATSTTLWAGQTITGTDVLVMYTYGGDANLDGKLNIDDYIRIDQGIAGSLTGWTNGDFNYDGKVNIDDYTTVIDSNIGTQGAAFATAGGVDGFSVTAIPEPLSAAGWAIASLLALARRTRRN